MSRYHSEYRSMNGDQRRALTDLIYERDGARCHICRLTVRREDASLDHLIPASRGGASTQDNLALAHLRCNQSRGDRALPAGSVPRHDGLDWFIDVA